VKENGDVRHGGMQTSYERTRGSSFSSRDCQPLPRVSWGSLPLEGKVLKLIIKFIINSWKGIRERDGLKSQKR